MSEARNPGGDATGLIQSLRQNKSAGPSLVDALVVESLVRGFLGRVFGRISAFAEGKVTRGLASSADQADCLYMAGHFSGRIGDYSVQPGWNPSGLAQSLRVALAGEIDPSESDESVISQLFALAVHRVYQVVSLPEDEQEPAVDALLRLTVMLLLGVRDQ